MTLVVVIDRYNALHLSAVVALSLRAWAPVFESIRRTLPQDLYDHFYPDWRAEQAKAVEDTLGSEDFESWVAIVDDAVAGFVALRLDAESKTGEIHMIAVDPDFQRRGIAAELTAFAVGRMKEAGMETAMVETGADPGHAPARATYEKAGFAPWPAVRYFRKL